MFNATLGSERFIKVPPVITRAELDDFKTLLYDEVGIKLDSSKRNMVSARLAKRLRALDLSSYGEYLEYLKSPLGRVKELDEFIDVMTTNKTEFFRERSHYDTLTSVVLPDVRSRMAPGEDFFLWSAACSTGEEPYSLAMHLYDHFLCVPESYSVLATDICSAALNRARKAVYADEVVGPMGQGPTRRFLLKGKGKQEGYWRVAPEIRHFVTFKRLNLMDEVFDLDRPPHSIWCRNVMIYFDTETKADLCRKLFRVLAPGGYLFIGHSESLNTISEEFVPVMPAVYRKPVGGRK
jgi:chemotaxis protein methyltransferase CheR